jgi:hypothetical protein
MMLFLASLATLFALISVVQATPTHQFDHFFAGWNGDVQRILHENCTAPLTEYLTGKVNYTLGKQSLVNPVIDCVLSVFPESKKAECKQATSFPTVTIQPSKLIFRALTVLRSFFHVARPMKYRSTDIL